MRLCCIIAVKVLHGVVRRIENLDRPFGIVTKRLPQHRVDIGSQAKLIALRIASHHFVGSLSQNMRRDVVQVIDENNDSGIKLISAYLFGGKGYATFWVLAADFLLPHRFSLTARGAIINLNTDMQDFTPDSLGKPPETAPIEKPPLAGANGALTIGQMLPDPASIDGRKLGKVIIHDIGQRYRQIIGLKPGSSSIRTVEMIEEILERLVLGEGMASILLDPNLPAPRTLWGWCRDDLKLDDDIKWARAMGQRMLKDITPDIASGGVFSTGDARRDELLIKVIEKNASQHNRAEFGDRIAVDQTVSVAPVMLPPIALPHDDEDD